jgi:hypothetical protein
MNENSMLKPALIGGVLLGILSALPLINYFNCICCAWIILGSGLAAKLYVKDSSTPVTLGRGVALGLLTGVIGTIVFALFLVPLVLLVGRGGPGIMEQLKQTVEQMPNVPPETREAFDAVFSQGNIASVFYIVGFFISLAINCIVAMIGGAIGVAVFEKRKPAAATAGPPQYQPPPEEPPPPPPSDTV